MRTPHPAGTFVELGLFRPPGAPARPVRAYLPATVAGGGEHPLLVLLDGQNVFGDEGSFAGGWHAHEAVDKLAVPPIVVAVENGGRHRIRELGAELDGFLRALSDELVPSLERRLPLAGPRQRVLGGASLGGLAALRAWLDHPEAWGGAMAMSPSLWFSRAALLREVERGGVEPPGRGRLYLDAGARERGRMFADARRLAALLEDRHGLGPERLLWRPDQRGTHHERHWRRRLPKALRFLFAEGKSEAAGRSDARSAG